MSEHSAITADNLRGMSVVYLDENSINRTLAELILQEAGVICTQAETIGVMIDAIARRSYDVVVVDIETVFTDQDGLELARREPRFRELPLIAVGTDAGKAATIGATIFIPSPLDPDVFLSAITKARGERFGTTTTPAIGRTALLARVGGKVEAAAELLTHFVHDYAGHDALIEEAIRRGDRDKPGFLLRNLRSAAGAIGADELYRLAADIQEKWDRNEPARLQDITEALRRAIKAAVELRNELGLHGSVGTPSIVRGLFPASVTAVLGPSEFSEKTNEESDTAYILAVDDSAANLKFIDACLSDEYRLILAPSGEEALKKARSRPTPDLILLDVTMPGIDGYETCRLLKEDPRTRSIPVIFLTSLSKEEDEERGLSLGAVDYIRKPFSVPILKARVRSQLELLRYREYLETLVEERTRTLRETQREVVFRLALAAEYRDNDTGSHIKRIGYYSMILADRMGFPRAESDVLYYASSMHDVGKIGIPDSILLKPGRLTEEEWEIMKQHTTIGAELLEGHPSELLRVASRIALTHHEKWDGSGYPTGLSEENIPMEGRIVAVCDVFDALLSARSYKKAWTYEETLDEVNRLSGTHFDPTIVHAFNDSFPEFVRIKERFKG